ncbi:MAG: hypothetical protein F6K17_16720 [Okeania sp. SIO3C4]|nr:hypothetical protein [Okeania sp. SIO3B3]NER04136.1 hypothetical protein [Okeania sp. SIO3C4]
MRFISYLVVFFDPNISNTKRDKCLLQMVGTLHTMSLRKKEEGRPKLG